MFSILGAEKAERRNLQRALRDAKVKTAAEARKRAAARAPAVSSLSLHARANLCEMTQLCVTLTTCVVTRVIADVFRIWRSLRIRTLSAAINTFGTLTFYNNKNVK